jgi:hypothetical protein
MFLVATSTRCGRHRAQDSLVATVLADCRPAVTLLVNGGDTNIGTSKYQSTPGGKRS